MDFGLIKIDSTAGKCFNKRPGFLTAKRRTTKGLPTTIRRRTTKSNSFSAQSKGAKMLLQLERKDHRTTNNPADILDREDFK